MIYELDGERPDIDKNAGFLAPDASIIGRVRLMAGASIWYQAVLRGDNEWITIGENSNIQDASILHTDMGAPLHIGSGVTVGHRVLLHGCRIADNALIGMGVTIMNHASIGEGTIIGANSLIPEGKEIPGGVLAYGSPARVVRDLTTGESAQIGWSAEHYVINAKRHRQGLVKI